MAYRVAVITVSDSASRGERIEDISGDTAQAILSASGYDVAFREVVPDERAEIAERMRALADELEVACIVTTGGTGLAARDVTPEATRDVIDAELPGMAEAMRLESLKKTPMAMLSRQVVGKRNGTLIVNLPGSPKAVDECLHVVLPVLGHALNLLAGHTAHKG